MTPIETLRALESKAIPGLWRATKAIIHGNGWDIQCPDQLGSHILQTKVEANLAVALRNLAPEFLALWEAANGMDYRHRSLEPNIYAALDALNVKAAEVINE